MSDPQPFSERQQKYAAWRDRLRNANDIIDLDDQEPAEDPWSTESLFQASRDVLEAEDATASE